MGRKNHYVPQVYLKGFCPNSGKLFRWTLEPENEHQPPISSKSFPPKGLGFGEDLYTINSERVLTNLGINLSGLTEEENAQYIEDRSFVLTENNFAKVRDRILANDYQNEDRKFMLQWFLELYFRNRRVIGFAREKHDPEINLKQTHEILQRIGYNGSLEQLKEKIETLRTERPELTEEGLAESYLYRSILDITDQSRNYPNREEFKRRNMLRDWTIFTTTNLADSYKFLTSNSPAFTHGNIVTGNPFNSHLIADYTKPNHPGEPDIVLPLTDSSILVIDGKISKNTQSITYKVSPNNLTDHFNYMIIKGSDGELYSEDRSLLERYNNQRVYSFLEDRYKEFRHNS